MSIVYITLIGISVLLVVSIITLIFVLKGLERMKTHVSDALQSSHNDSVGTLTNIAALTQTQLENVSNRTQVLGDKTERQLIAMRELMQNWS